MKKDNKTFGQMLKFTLFSISAGVIQTAVFTLLNELLKLDHWVSYFIALACSVLYNFTLNRKFTFKSAKNVPVAMLLAALFYVFFAPYSIYLTDFLTLKGLNEYLVLFINMVQNLALEFLWCRFIVYRNNIDTAKTENRKEETIEDAASSDETEEIA